MPKNKGTYVCRSITAVLATHPQFNVLQGKEVRTEEEVRTQPLSKRERLFTKKISKVDENCLTI